MSDYLNGAYEYITCPHCGVPWKGFHTVYPVGSETPAGVFLQYSVSHCCGCSAEYLAKVYRKQCLSRLAEAMGIPYSRIVYTDKEEK